MQSPEYEKRYKDPQTGAVRRNVLFRGVYQGVWSVVLSTIPACKSFFILQIMYALLLSG